MDPVSNPWTTLSKATVYENAWILVEEHQVINPGRVPGIYGKIHFKNIAVAILPIDEKGYTWIVGQYRYPLDSYEWELPEGGCHEGEQPLQAAERELTEETGLKAALFTPVLEMQLSNSATDEISISYVATGLSHGPSSPEVDEKLEVKKIHFDELVDMVERGEIKDALSVATILRVHLLKAKGQLDRF